MLKHLCIFMSWERVVFLLSFEILTVMVSVSVVPRKRLPFQKRAFLLDVLSAFYLWGEEQGRLRKPHLAVSFEL